MVETRPLLELSNSSKLADSALCYRTLGFFRDAMIVRALSTSWLSAGRPAAAQPSPSGSPQLCSLQLDGLHRACNTLLSCDRPAKSPAGHDLHDLCWSGRLTDALLVPRPLTAHTQYLRIQAGKRRTFVLVL